VDHYLNFSKKLPDLPCAGEALRRVTITKFCYFLECARFELVNWTMRMRAEDFSYQQAIRAVAHGRCVFPKFDGIKRLMKGITPKMMHW